MTRASNSRALCLTVLVAALTAVVLALTETKPAEAAFPGTNGKIAFASTRDGTPEIYTMNADGSDQQRLTNDTRDDRTPVLSADGKKIVYQSNLFGVPDIWVMNADGSGKTNLTNDSALESSPTWSLDGTKIAFVLGGDIWIMNADGSDKSNITNTPASEDHPEWSPDGTKIAFDYPGSGSTRDEIWTMNADGSGRQQITCCFAGNDAFPSWSPDGTQIVFDSSRSGGAEVYVVGSGGGTETRLVSIAQGNGWLPAWSPDGSKIAFVSSRNPSNGNDIWVMAANGSDQQLLATAPATDTAPDWGVAVTDTTPPITSVTSSPVPNGAGWNSSDVTVNLTATDNAGGQGVKEITYSATGAQTIPSTPVSGSSAQVNVSVEGETTISYFASDNAGNHEAAKTLVVKLDKTRPGATINLGPDEPTNDNTPTFSFGGSDNLTANADLLFSYKVDNGGWSDYASATSITLGGPAGLDDGPHTFFVKARDLAGNESDGSAERGFTVDTAAPGAPAIGNPANNNYDTDGNVTVSGNAEAGSTVKLFESGNPEPVGTVTADAGNWSVALTELAEGSHAYTAMATDAAGNTSDASSQVTVIVDKTAPTVTGVTPQAGATGVSRLTNVTATFSERMDPATLVDPSRLVNNVTLTNKKTGARVQATVTVGTDGKTVTLRPSSALAKSTQYEAGVKGGTGGAKDPAGNPLATDKVWSFTTAKR